ncbi:MAG: bifunctional nuclease family protein [Sediminibacterium sp.]
MEKIEVQLIALNNSESSPGNFVVVLEAVPTKKRMAIIIGAFEAQAIAIHMERMQLPRPLTHDIFKSALLELGAVLKEVIIHNIIDGMFHAWLVITAKDKEEIKVDVRASDALALAVRFDCPIYIYDYVLTEAAIKEDINKWSLLKGSIAEYSLQELEILLKDVLAKEDYESAARVRDMIKKRTQ